LKFNTWWLGIYILIKNILSTQTTYSDKSLLCIIYIIYDANLQNWKLWNRPWIIVTLSAKKIFEINLYTPTSLDLFEIIVWECSLFSYFHYFLWAFSRRISSCLSLRSVHRYFVQSWCLEHSALEDFSQWLSFWDLPTLRYRFQHFHSLHKSCYHWQLTHVESTWNVLELTEISADDFVTLEKPPQILITFFQSVCFW